MAMVQCPSCDGFVPPRIEACPHCDAGVATRRRARLRRVLEVAGGGAIAFTLMACYGAPPHGWHGPADPARNANGDCPSVEDDLDRDGWCDADCDEVDPDTFPGASDPPGDGLDQNCDGADGEAGVAEPSGDVQTIAR